MIGQVNNGRSGILSLPCYTGKVGVRERAGSTDVAFLLEPPAVLSAKDRLLQGAVKSTDDGIVGSKGDLDGVPVTVAKLDRSLSDPRMVTLTLI